MELLKVFSQYLLAAAVGTSIGSIVSWLATRNRPGSFFLSAGQFPELRNLSEDEQQSILLAVTREKYGKFSRFFESLIFYLAVGVPGSLTLALGKVGIIPDSILIFFPMTLVLVMATWWMLRRLTAWSIRAAVRREASSILNG
jgi:hypothetical protein